MRIIILMFLAMICCNNTLAQQPIYETDFDSLTLGETQSPALAGQDGWRAGFQPGNSFSEIQDSVARCGNAFHQFTDITNTEGQQSISSRSFEAVDLSSVSELIFEIYFYASSSDLSARNSFTADARLDGDGVLYDISIGSGNGNIKSEVGVSIGLSMFNGTSNNIPFSPNVGQNLAWDTWHSVKLRADLQALEWVSITVNGQEESLEGIPLRRNSGATFPTELDQVVLQIINRENSGDETSDSIFFDNLSIRVTENRLLGDVNLDDVVNFLDIAPFIALLSSATFQFEADIDGNGDVDFLDIAPFIAILAGQ